MHTGLEGDIGYALGHMQASLSHVANEQDRQWKYAERQRREIQKLREDLSRLKEHVDMIDRRWRSVIAFISALVMIAANIIDKDGIHLIGEALGLLK